MDHLELINQHSPLHFYQFVHCIICVCSTRKLKGQMDEIYFPSLNLNSFHQFFEFLMKSTKEVNQFSAGENLHTFSNALTNMSNSVNMSTKNNSNYSCVCIIGGKSWTPFWKVDVFLHNNHVIGQNVVATKITALFLEYNLHEPEYNLHEPEYNLPEQEHLGDPPLPPRSVFGKKRKVLRLTWNCEKLNIIFFPLPPKTSASQISAGVDGGWAEGLACAHNVVMFWNFRLLVTNTKL
jgi:hypothetical protein